MLGRELIKAAGSPMSAMGLKVAFGLGRFDDREVPRTEVARLVELRDKASTSHLDARRIMPSVMISLPDQPKMLCSKTLKPARSAKCRIMRSEKKLRCPGLSR